jgi:hypothetical protein
MDFRDARYCSVLILSVGTITGGGMGEWVQGGCDEERGTVGKVLRCRRKGGGSSMGAKSLNLMKLGRQIYHAKASSSSYSFCYAFSLLSSLVDIFPLIRTKSLLPLTYTDRS